MKSIIVLIISLVLAFLVNQLFLSAGNQFIVAYLGGGIAMWIVCQLSNEINKNER